MIDGPGLADEPREAGDDLEHVQWHNGDEIGFLRDEVHLVLYVVRVVSVISAPKRSFIGVMMRRDWCSLGIGLAMTSRSRGAQGVAPDLDVALLEDVEQGDLDALGEIGNSLMAKMPCSSRDEPEVDGLGIPSMRPSEPSPDPHRRRDRRRTCREWRASRRTSHCDASR